MKKTNSVLFTKRNDIHPFTDFKPLEHFSTKNDTSLIVLTNHSKKRPHNLTFIRMFDHQVMDMVEFGIKEFFPMAIFEVSFLRQIGEDLPACLPLPTSSTNPTSKI